MRPDPSSMSSCHLLDEYLTVYRDCGRRRGAIRAELESRLEGQPEIAKMRIERDAARSQLQADDQRAWEALGRPDGTHETSNVQRLCAEVERLTMGATKHRQTEATYLVVRDENTRLRAEVERLRADMREAMTLLLAHGQPPDWIGPGRNADWTRRYGALLARHKETNL